ncbi:MAG: NAD-dependent epimerase/dehydratase family protein [Planctomycetes bacterium]|nr:NAD-dependent epimerase/dehydratase family protein [Planctomycetota bacterium]
MKILVTGAAGFLGSNLTPLLLDAGFDVVGFDDLSHGFLRNVEPLLAHPRFRFEQGDVRDLPAMLRCGEGAGAVVHLAAGKIPRYGNSLETLDVNLVGVRHALEVCRASGARAVIASTSDVYGMSSALPFREDGVQVLGSPTVRRWAYAVSKLAAEHLALAYRETYGTPVVLLRFFGAYGEHQNVTWWGGPQSVFIGAALRDQELEIHGDGLQTRSFTYVGDTVRGIFAAVTNPRADGEIFNIGNDREITIRGLAEMVWRIVRPGTEPKLKIVPYETFGKYEDVRHRVPETTKSREMLGFTAMVPLEEGLPRTVAWQARIEGLPFPVEHA